MADSLRKLLRRVLYLACLRRLDADLAEELEFHRTMKQRELEATGLPEREARLHAQRVMGNVALARDLARDQWQPRSLQGLGVDIRLAVRLLIASPILSAVAVASLALGIGANTAIFSLINGIYLRPLPVQEPDRLIYLAGPRRTGQAGVELWRALRERPKLFEHAAAYSETQFNISSGIEARWVDGLYASGAFFDTMGVGAAAGRLFSPVDDRRGGGPDGLVAVISFSLWQRQFGGSLDAIGRRFDINHVPVTVIGVTPARFFGPSVGRSFDVIVPLETAAAFVSEEIEVPGDDVIARLWPGQTLHQANAELHTAVAAAQEVAGPITAVSAATGRSPMRGQYDAQLAALLIVVALVLLIACANVANLMLARATARRHELSVRRALGGSRWRLVRQCLTEALVLAVVSATCGLAIAFWSRRLIVQLLATEDALTAGQIAFGSARLVLDVPFDWRVLAFTTVATALTALVFGIAPAFRASSADPIDAIKTGAAIATQPTGSTSPFRLGHISVGATGWILVIQVAFSLVLVVAAALFTRTFAALSAVPLGFDADRVLVADIDVTRAASARSTRLGATERVRAEISALPGVAAAALSVGRPPIEWGAYERFTVFDGPPVSDARGLATIVSPGWFDALGVPIVAGRDFSWRDRPGAPRVAIVNEAFVRVFIGGASPLGRLITSFEWPVEIVGVAGNTLAGRLQDGPSPIVFLPIAQIDGRLGDLLHIYLEERGLVLNVRPAAGVAAAWTHRIAETVSRVDPRLGLTFHAPRDQIDALMSRERTLATLAGLFGVLSVILAAIGLYGVTVYSMARQRKEIAIRMALGATSRRLAGIVLARILMLVALGVVAGVTVSAWAGQLVAGLLYGVEPRDPATLAGASVLMAFFAVVVAWLPTRRAARTDPAVVLRYE